MELLQKVASLFTLVFVVSTMLTMGLGLTVGQILAPLRNVRLLTLSLAANFVLMPLVAIGLARLLRLEESMSIGLLLLGASGGSPVLPVFVKTAKGHVALAVGLMVLMMVVSIGFLPLALPVLLPGVSVDPTKIVASLGLTMLLPLATGLIANARLARLAAQARPLLDWLSKISLMLVLILFVGLNGKGVIAIVGSGAILAALLFIVIGHAAGWLLGGPDIETRRVVGLGTASRNFAGALIVAAQSFSDPEVLVMIVIIVIATLVLLVPLSHVMAKRTPAFSA